MSEVLYRHLDPEAPGELNFVRKSLIRYVKQPPTSLIDRYYATAAKQTVAELLKRSTVTVAEYSKRPGQLFGYAVYEPGLIHAVYVKKDFRDATNILSDLINLACAGWDGPPNFTVRCPASKHYPKGSVFRPDRVNQD